MRPRACALWYTQTVNLIHRARRVGYWVERAGVMRGADRGKMRKCCSAREYAFVMPFSAREEFNASYGR